tara:strand:- start:104 stop:691 length:588 start_codon:yes stop_codon:yes gene_type:complete
MRFHKLALAAAPAALLLTPASAFAAPETYVFDASHTAVEFQIDHFGFSSPTGKWMSVDGTLTLDEEDPAASSVSLTIDVAEVVTGVPDLDAHLKKEDFFYVDEYPTATFESESVELTGEDTAEVTGMLTLRGVTKPVTLDVKLNKIGENMMGKKTAGFSATTTLLRSDFNMDTYAPGLSDEVTLMIETEANLQSE